MKRPKYKTKQDAFFIELKEQVFAVLDQDYRKKANARLAIKALGLLLFFLFCIYWYWNSSQSSVLYLLMATLMGICCVPLILNIGHESVHRNLSTHSEINKIGKNIFFLLGTSDYFWELRHNSSHHAFSNVSKYDLDIEQSKIIRLSEHQAARKHHKYQHLYMPLAFCFYTLSWFFIRDFIDIRKKKFGSKQLSRHPMSELVKLILAKIWHVAALLVIPYALGHSFVMVLAGFFVFHLAASVTTTFALISTHVGEEQEIVRVNEEMHLPYTWAEHQLRTTADFSTRSSFALHFFGGFNHHVAHHLFPHVPHI